MKRILSLLLTVLLLLSALSGCGEPTLLDPADPVTLTMWHVYGEQADSPMNRLVTEFNESVGLEQGIVIDVTAMSNGAMIGSKLLSAQAGTPGEPDMPDLFFCHTNNAAALGADRLVDWNLWFSEEEQSHFVKEFLEEGVIDRHLAVFPVSKSTHLLFLNGTRFDQFSADTGITEASLATWEGFFQAAQAYYEWSGGKQFCSLDFPLRAAELSALAQGGEVKITDGWYDESNEALYQAWMPFAHSLSQGHIGLSDLYANTQIMTGEVIAGLGSSAAILYYNDVVTFPDNTTEPMNLRVLPMPQPQDADVHLATQAGVGLCAYATTEQKAEAASVFAHWLTEGQRNLEFVAETGYMPVNTEAFDAISSYTFPTDAYASLYSALSATRNACTSVIEPSYAGFYEKVGRFYTQLRQLQPELKERSEAGESVDSLAQETWDLFQSIQ